MLLHDPLIQSIRRRLHAQGISPLSRIGVGVSGGADSMVLLYALHKLGFATEALHVNFNLRGLESEADAAFVVAWCASQDIPSRVYAADTLAYKSAHLLSTQEAARDIRYTWWKQLHDQDSFDFLATGHHLDDNIETIWLRLLRGTGIHGLSGIPERRDFIIRPMLDVKAEDIRAFAARHGIPYREDSSNQTDGYLRNKIRHHLLPLLDALSPNHRAAMRHNIRRWQAELQAWTDQSPLQVVNVSGGYQLYCPAPAITHLCDWLESKGVPWTLSYEYLSATGHPGRPALHHGTWQLTRDGIDRYVFHQPGQNVVVSVEEPGSFPVGDKLLSLAIVEKPTDLMTANGELTAYLALEAIQWPILCRNLRPGDSMKPLGMGGHRKRLSDLLTDKKITPYGRTKTLVLESGGEIIWVPGLRLADRVKVMPEAQTVLRISLLPLETPAATE